MNTTKVIKALKTAYPEAKCSLNYKNKWQLLTAVILSAQCTDKRVNQTTPILFKKYPTVKKITKAKQEDIEDIIKPTGFYHNKAKAIHKSALKILQEHNGEVPETMQDLINLPGVGRKTANVILSEGFKKAEGIVVDVHVARISYRLGWTRHKDPKKIEQDLIKQVPKKYWIHFSHLLIDHGRAICKAPTPYCSKCPLKGVCQKQGVTKSY